MYRCLTPIEKGTTEGLQKIALFSLLIALFKLIIAFGEYNTRNKMVCNYHVKSFLNKLWGLMEGGIRQCSLK